MLVICIDKIADLNGHSRFKRHVRKRKKLIEFRMSKTNCSKYDIPIFCKIRTDFWYTNPFFTRQSNQFTVDSSFYFESSTPFDISEFQNISNRHWTILTPSKTYDSWPHRKNIESREHVYSDFGQLSSNARAHYQKCNLQSNSCFIISSALTLTLLKRYS